MKDFRPVEIPDGAFVFCKTTIPTLLWISLILRSPALVLAVCIVLVVSALLGVSRAPLVFLYAQTVNRLWPSRSVIVDERAVRFAHTVGAIMSAAALLFLFYFHPLTGWIIVALLAALKTSGALGFCGAMKLYGCLNNPDGTCCRGGRAIKKARDRHASGDRQHE